MFFQSASVLSGTLANLRTNLGIQIYRHKTKSPGTKTHRVKSWTGAVRSGGTTYFPRLYQLHLNLADTIGHDITLQLVTDTNNWATNKIIKKRDTDEDRHIAIENILSQPGEVDPPYEPTQLFMIHRIKPVKGNPYWQKDILRDLGIDGKLNAIAIVKNEPCINGKLWKIKHLIKITPITLPDELPSEDDLGAGYLKENGEFVVSKRLVPNEKRLEETNNYIFSPLKLDGETLRKFLRLKWLNT